MTAETWDDDRPGMMRIHVAEQRAQALCDRYTRDTLRELAHANGVPAGYATKTNLAFALALAGVKP